MLEEMIDVSSALGLASKFSASYSLHVSVLHVFVRLLESYKTSTLISIGEFIAIFSLSTLQTFKQVDVNHLKATMQYTGDVSELQLQILSSIEWQYKPSAFDILVGFFNKDDSESVIECAIKYLNDTCHQFRRFSSHIRALSAIQYSRSDTVSTCQDSTLLHAIFKTVQTRKRKRNLL